MRQIDNRLLYHGGEREVTLIRHYVLQIAPTDEDLLLSTMRNLMGVVKEMPGFEGSELMRNTDRAGGYVYIEKWTDVMAYENHHRLVSEDQIAPLLSVLAKPIEGDNMNSLALY